MNMDETEPLWSGTQEGVCFPSLQLAPDTIHPCQHVRVLEVEFSADLSLEKHVTKVSATCFYHLSSVCLCVVVYTELLHGISRHTAPQSLRLPQDIIFVLLPVISLLCRLTD